MSLLNMVRSFSDHNHDGGGAVVQGARPGPRDPIAPQLSATDREVYEQICEAVNGKLATIQKGVEERMNAARIAGTLPKFTSDERLPALKSGLDDLRNRLSPAGWLVLEKFFNDMAISMGRVSGPARQP